MKNMKTLLAILTLGTTVGNLSGLFNTNLKIANISNLKENAKKSPTFNSLYPNGLENKTVYAWENIGDAILASVNYASNYLGLYKSIDGGNTFTEIKNTGIEGVDGVFSLLNVNGTIYAATHTQNKGKKATSLYKSIDGGNTFTEIKNTGLGGWFVESLLNVNGTIYAGTNNGLWTSTDGQHFSKLKTFHFPGTVVSMVVSNDGVFYAACTTSGTTGKLYKSIDGINFTEVLTPNVLGWVSSLLNVNGTIYAGTYANDYKNKDLGDLYTMVEDKFTKLENTGIVDKGSSMPINSLLNVNGTIYVQVLGILFFKQSN